MSILNVTMFSLSNVCSALWSSVLDWNQFPSLASLPIRSTYMVIVYPFLSVWQQEIIYRTFFFKRYESLFKSKSLLVFVNAIVFSLAHIFFSNTLVMILTFIGGILFAWTYLKFRSTTLVSIEHALYGNWLFTVGMGQMLAFPGMEG